MVSCLTNRTEHKEQCAVFEWAELMSNEHPELGLMFAIPNGGARPYKISDTAKGEIRYSFEGKKLKKEGVKEGVPDIFLPAPRGKYHGLFIEMKRYGGGVVRKTQKKWLTNLAQQGYFVVVCKDSDAALRVLKGYMGLEKDQQLTF